MTYPLDLPVGSIRWIYKVLNNNPADCFHCLVSMDIDCFHCLVSMDIDCFHCLVPGEYL
jgi:hypothetical protein